VPEQQGCQRRMWPKLRRYFRIERNGEPIEKHIIRHSVNPGISYGRLIPILVPLYEEQEALRYANYNYREWRKLEPWERALGVAHYRYSRLIKLHGQDALSDEMDREIKKAKRK